MKSATIWRQSCRIIIIVMCQKITDCNRIAILYLSLIFTCELLWLQDVLWTWCTTLVIITWLGLWFMRTIVTNQTTITNTNNECWDIPAHVKVRLCPKLWDGTIMGCNNYGIELWLVNTKEHCWWILAIMASSYMA